MAALVSCQRCYMRKIRCDKASPKCTACQRADSECLPAVNSRTQPQLKKRYREHEDNKAREESLLARIAFYERHFSKLGIDPKTLHEAPDPMQSTRSGSESAADLTSTEPKHRYFNEAEEWGEMIHGRFDNALNCWLAAKPFGSHEMTTQYDRKYPVDGTHWLFGEASKRTDFPPDHPTPFVIFELWRTYQRSVQPLAHLLHEATMDDILFHAGPKLNEANADDPVDARDHALLFAMYHAAVSSMQPDAVQRLFDKDRREMLLVFRVGTKHWLNKSGFCRTTDLRVLQALVVYLVSLDLAVDPRAMLTLIGLSRRILQRVRLPMLVDKAGESLDLDFIHRLGWELQALDVRMMRQGASLGVHVPSPSELLETLPSLSPDWSMPSTPKTYLARSGQSASMSGCKTLMRVRYELLHFSHQMRTCMGSHTSLTEFTSRSISLTAKLGKIDDFHEYMKRQYFASDDGTWASSIRFGRLFLDWSALEMRLSSTLCEDRFAHIDSGNDGDVAKLRIDNLRLCRQHLELFIAIRNMEDAFAAGWHKLTISYHYSFLHLFRLVRLCIAHDPVLVRDTWDFINTHYEKSHIGGQLLASNPDRPGTFDRAMVKSWDDTLEAATAAKVHLLEPQCIRDARIRFANLEATAAESGKAPAAPVAQDSVLGQQEQPWLDLSLLELPEGADSSWWWALPSDQWEALPEH